MKFYNFNKKRDKLYLTERVSRDTTLSVKLVTNIKENLIDYLIYKSKFGVLWCYYSIEKSTKFC
jgi:hypothetical protein